MQRWIWVTIVLVFAVLAASAAQLPVIRADESPTPVAFVYVPNANGPMQTPTVTSTPEASATATATATSTGTVTPTRTPTPVPIAPGDPTDFSLAISGSTATVKWTAPEGQDLRFRYIRCRYVNSSPLQRCNLTQTTDADVFVSDYATVGSGEQKTLLVSGIGTGYTCFWIQHKFGISSQNPSSPIFPKTNQGTDANCVFR